MLVDTCYTEEEVRRQKDEQVRQQKEKRLEVEVHFCPVPRDCQSDGEDGPGLELPQLPHHQVGSNFLPELSSSKGSIWRDKQRLRPSKLEKKLTKQSKLFKMLEKS